MRSRLIQFAIATLLMMGIVLGCALAITHWIKIELTVGFWEWFTLIAISAGHGYIWALRTRLDRKPKLRS